MDPRVDIDGLVANWTLVGDEAGLVAGKRGATRLGFALLLKFYGQFGHFIEGPEVLGVDAVDFVAGQVDVDAAVLGQYEWVGRANGFHRAQIREHFGFRVCSTGDAD